MARSRHMRFFVAEGDRERFREPEGLSVTAYLRDTGEVMVVVRAPVFVRGGYWGTLAMGLTAQAFGL